MERGFNSENMEEVNEYILNNVSPYDREGVKRNLGPTTIIREEIRKRLHFWPAVNYAVNRNLNFKKG